MVTAANTRPRAPSGTSERTERDIERLAHDERYRMLFTESPWPHIVCDRTTLRIVDANAACLRLYGYARHELLALTLYDLDGDRERLKQAIASVAEDFVELGEWTHRTKNDTHIEVELIAHRLQAPVPAYLIVVRDVTEARRLTQQLVQSQKMEAIGRLAGGIAHDFNNVLTAIFSYVELCLAPGADSKSIHADIESIRGAAERASALTHQLLAFSRKQVMRLRAVSLNLAVTDIEKILRRVMGEDVELVISLDPAIGSARADPSQIGQVILNLGINARDAMPNGGRLTIETRNVEVDAAHEHDLAPGPYVCLSMTDTGTGMDDATRRLVFEPFFTTKPVGKGTGLGLSTVFGIVKQTGGGVAVDSRPGHGSTFRVYLPRTKSDSVVPAAANGAGQTSPIRGSGTLLLVEDDVQVRNALLRLLTDRGFRVLPVCGMAEALALLDGNGGEHVDLMVTDMVMPGGSGATLAKEARARLPGLRVLFMSGYAKDGFPENLLEPGSSFMAKPFVGSDLDCALRSLTRMA